MDSENVCFLCLDFETGGLRPHVDPRDKSSLGSPILQYGAILIDQDLNYIDSVKSLVKPAAVDSFGSVLEINQQALDVNKLNPDVCISEGQTVAKMLDALEAICSQAGDRPIVLTGSNPEFDRGFWQEACYQEGRKMPRIRRRALDTYELNVSYLTCVSGYSMRKALDNASLEKFMKIMETPHDAHDAMGDCIAGWKCLALHFQGRL